MSGGAKGAVDGKTGGKTEDQLEEGLEAVRMATDSNDEDEEEEEDIEDNNLDDNGNDGHHERNSVADKEDEAGAERRRKMPNSNAKQKDCPRQRTESPTSSISSTASRKKRDSLPGISVHDLLISSPKPISRPHHLPHPVVDVTPATPTSPVGSGSEMSQVPSPARSRSRNSNETPKPRRRSKSAEEKALSVATASSSTAPIPPITSSPFTSPSSSSPRRFVMSRLPSQVIAESPSSEAAGSLSASPSQEHAPPSISSRPSFSPISTGKMAENSNDYRFPRMDPESPHQRTGAPAQENEEESFMVTSPQSENGPSALSPTRTPSRSNLRKNSASSAHSSQSVNEYSTPSGFLKHRRTSSMNAPKEVKESINAGCKELPDGKRKLNQYVLTRDIGRGSFGVVQLAKDEDTGKEYAVKEFSKMRLRKRQQSEILRRQGRGGARRGAVPMRRKQQGSRPNSRSPGRKEEENGRRDLDLIRSEVAIMKKLDHPNVVRLYEVLDIQEDDSLFMVVELCGNGPLMFVGMGQKSESMSEEDTRNYFRQIVLAIEYLHYNGIIHRDIKPENILKMSDPIDAIKVCDFGVSEMFTKEDADNPHELKSGGSPAFMSPELCITHAGKISGKAADIWALGVTLYCMVVGHLPFEATQMLDLYDQIKNEPVKMPKELSEDLKDLLRRMLEKSPDQRIKIKELRNHPWVTLDGNDPLPSTDVNVTSLPEVTEQDVQEAIAVPSVSYIVNAVRAASRWKRFAGRRRYSEGHESTTSSLGSSDMSRSGSMELVSSAMSRTRSRNGSMESRRTSIDFDSPQGSTPVTSLPTSGGLSNDLSPVPWHQPSTPSNQKFSPAASFPLSAFNNEKGGVLQSQSDFPDVTSIKSHADYLSMGIDDSNVETVRYYEDQTGHYMPRDAVKGGQNRFLADPNQSRREKSAAGKS